MTDYSLFVPTEIAEQSVWITDDARRNGIHIVGSSGSGKSRLMGRMIAYSDFLRGYPMIILDPAGGTIDNFLDALMRLPAEYQEVSWPRVIHVDMSGRAGVVPWPLYYRLTAEESLYTTAQRFLEVVRRLDPALEGASVEGWNAVYKLGTYTGMILAALGFQITEAEDLIRNPKRWWPRFEQALARYPEVQPAVAFFQDFSKMTPTQRSRLSQSFLTKILVFNSDPLMRAMFGAAAPGIDWRQVVQTRSAVLLDFRHEQTKELKRFKLLWCYANLVEFFKERGFAGRKQPVSFIIDELSQLLSLRAEGQSIMADDLEELISVVARNYGVMLTIAHQSLAQFGA